MPPITRFDRATCRRLGHETAEALQTLAKQYGITVRYAGGTFSDGNCKLKVEYVAQDADGHAQTPEREAWGRCCIAYELRPDDLGREFRDYNGNRFVIVGCTPGSPRYPILAQRTDGKRFKFPAQQVRHALGRVPGPDLVTERAEDRR